jgi:superfamily I DNA/RNA helicase
MTLTQAQQRAVERTGQDVCVVAGPGSGKTRVLVERFRWLVEAQGVAPGQILTITFTEKAAYEIRRRLARIFAHDASRRSEVERAPVGTIHGFCTRLLKENAIAAQLDPEFSILDDRDATLLLHDAVHRALNEFLTSEPERLKRLYERWDVINPAAAIAALYRKVRLDGFAIPDREGDAGTIGDILRLTHETLAAVKRAQSALDFDDLEEFSIRLLESSETLRAQVQLRYEHILMDEVQDTNPLQWRLVNLLRTPGCFFAVGDVNQAIYGFRDARPDGFLNLRREVESAGGAVDMLAENFRSRAEILEAAAEATHGEPGIEPVSLQPCREFRDGSAAVERFFVAGRAADEEAEARWVAKRILSLTGSFAVEHDGSTRPARFADIALLFRTTARFPIFAAEFHAAGIPYLVTGGRALFARQEVMDAVSWLKVLANPRDEVALAAVLLSPFAGFDAEAVIRLRDPGRNLWESVCASKAPEIRRLTELIHWQRAQIGDTAPGLLIGQALDTTGYDAGLDDPSRANVSRLIAILDSRADAAGETPAGLVRYLKRIAERGEADAPPANSTNAVRMMTMHAAKGLEFPIVFLPSLDVDPKADTSGVFYSAAHGLGAKWRDESGDGVKDETAEILSAQAKEDRAAESSRLLYVAMTRAEQKLILSAAKSQRGWTKRILRLEVPNAREEFPESVTREAEDRETIIVRRPAPVPHGDEVSASDLALFTLCPRRYFLQSYVGWGDPPEPMRPAETSSGLVEKLHHAHDKQEFPLHEGGHCIQCPYFQGACPATAGQGQLELFG